MRYHYDSISDADDYLNSLAYNAARLNAEGAEADKVFTLDQVKTAYAEICATYNCSVITFRSHDDTDNQINR